MTSSILLCENTFQRTKEMINIANVSFFSDTTWDSLQDRYVFPAVNIIYNVHKESIILRAREEERLILLDSPGYFAKYRTYTLINSNFGKILDFNVIHVAQAAISETMELVSLKLLLTSMEFRNVTVSFLTADQHQQVRTYIKKDKPNINHQFDIWHVVKSIKRKLAAEAKKSKCQDLDFRVESIKSIINFCGILKNDLTNGITN